MPVRKTSTAIHPLLANLRVVAVGYVAKAAGPLRLDSQPHGAAFLLYCRKGSGWCEFEGLLHTIRAGDVALVRPGVPFICSAHASQPWTVHWAFAEGLQLASYSQELGLTSQAPVMHVGDDSHLARLFNEIQQALSQSDRLPSALQAAHALGQLLAMLLARLQNHTRQDSDAVQRVAEAIIYMSEHLEEPLRITTLARLASFSPAHFTTLFRSQTGCSPRDYLHLLRIHRACQLLRDSTLTIKEIAARIGYLDPFHFSRQFRAFEGISPKKYRESGRI